MIDAQTYQLVILVSENLRIRIGALGLFEFPAGYYVYTGSARKNMQARIQRHLRSEKKLRWHIDYLLAQPGVRIIDIFYSAQAECEANQTIRGCVLVPRFGASDCQNRCGSHLKFLGKEKPKSGGRNTILIRRGILDSLLAICFFYI